MVLGLLPFPWVKDMGELSQRSPAGLGIKQSPQPSEHVPMAPAFAQYPQSWQAQ